MADAVAAAARAQNITVEVVVPGKSETKKSDFAKALCDEIASKSLPADGKKVKGPQTAEVSLVILDSSLFGVDLPPPPPPPPEPALAPASVPSSPAATLSSQATVVERRKPAPVPSPVEQPLNDDRKIDPSDIHKLPNK